VVFRISGPAPLAVAAEYPTVSLTKATPGVQRTGGGVGGGGAGREGKSTTSGSSWTRDTTKKNSARFRLRLEGLQSAAHQRVEHEINIPVSTVEISESSRCQDAAAAVPTHARTSTAADRMTFWVGMVNHSCDLPRYRTILPSCKFLFIFPLLLQLCKLVQALHMEQDLECDVIKTDTASVESPSWSSWLHPFTFCEKQAPGAAHTNCAASQASEHKGEKECTKLGRVTQESRGCGATLASGNLSLWALVVSARHRTADDTCKS
jgi:hypothetical protein